MPQSIKLISGCKQPRSLDGPVQKQADGYWVWNIFPVSSVWDMKPLKNISLFNNSMTFQQLLQHAPLEIIWDWILRECVLQSTQDPRGSTLSTGLKEHNLNMKHKLVPMNGMCWCLLPFVCSPTAIISKKLYNHRKHCIWKLISPHLIQIQICWEQPVVLVVTYSEASASTPSHSDINMKFLWICLIGVSRSPGHDPLRNPDSKPLNTDSDGQQGSASVWWQKAGNVIKSVKCHLSGVHRELMQIALEVKWQCGVKSQTRGSLRDLSCLQLRASAIT